MSERLYSFAKSVSFLFFEPLFHSPNLYFIFIFLPFSSLLLSFVPSFLFFHFIHTLFLLKTFAACLIYWRQEYRRLLLILLLLLFDTVYIQPEQSSFSFSSKKCVCVSWAKIIATRVTHNGCYAKAKEPHGTQYYNDTVCLRVYIV